MADKTKAAGFDSDPSLKHRTLWNDSVAGDLRTTGVTWCADNGALHAIDDPRDLCLTDAAKKTYAWDGTSPIASAPLLLKLITDGNAALAEKRQKALKLSLGATAPYESVVDTTMLTKAEREVIRRLKKAIPILEELDVLVKDARNTTFAAYLAQKKDKLGLEQFEKLHFNGCIGALARIDASLIPYCSPVDYFPNDRPKSSEFPTEFVPPDFTETDAEKLSKAFPADGMWNPFLLGVTVLTRDAAQPSGWKWTAAGQDPRYAAKIDKLAEIAIEASMTPDLDPALKTQLQATAATLRSADPVVSYLEEAVWAMLRTGNIEIGYGLSGGYSQLGKVRGAGLTLSVVRKGEAAFLEQHVFPRLQQAETKLAGLLKGLYAARTISGKIPVRVVDVLFNSEHSAYQTLAFIGPTSGPLGGAGISKSVVIANHHEAKFEKVLKPLAAEAFVPEQAALVGKEQFVMESAAHESSHAIGPRDDTMKNGRTIRSLIGDDNYDSIEESKANTGGIVVMSLIAKDGVKPVDAVYMQKMYVTYVAGILRQMRFGGASHGGGAAAEINFLFANGGISVVDAVVAGKQQKRIKVDLEKMPEVVEKLWAHVAGIEARGDKAAAEKYMTDLNAIPSAFDKEILPRANAAGVPIDVNMIYKEKTK